MWETGRLFYFSLFKTEIIAEFAVVIIEVCWNYYDYIIKFIYCNFGTFSYDFCTGFEAVIFINLFGEIKICFFV